ncbi:MAG: DIP1984 family protein, partial [Tumebacillaceae bacterium]
QLEQLIKSINRTNATTPFDETRTIADALAERDTLSSRRQMLNSVIQSLMHRQDRYSHSEIRMVTTIDANDLQKQIDKLSKEFRELDTRIQEQNWRTELIEA